MNEEFISPRPVRVGKGRYLPTGEQMKGKTHKKIFSLREKTFINLYLSGENAYQSALKAGYSKATANIATIVLLRNQKISAEVARRTKNNLSEVTADDIQRETAKLAFANIMDYIVVQPDGSFKIDLSHVDREQGAAIQELGFDAQGNPKIRLPDKKACLELLGRFKKMLSDKSEGSFVGDGQPLTIERLDAIVQNVVNNVTVNNYPSQSGHLLPETIEAT